MAEGLFALARHMGAEFILGIADAQHVARKKNTKFFKYDAFWEELGGKKNADGDFALPLLSEHKPLAEVEVRRRAQYRRRRAHLEMIAQQTLESLQEYWPQSTRPNVDESASTTRVVNPLLNDAV